MRASIVRSLVLAVGCALLATWAPAPVEAATCDKICETDALWGYGDASAGYASCQCTEGTGAARTGPHCGCGVCYKQVGAKVTGYARLANGDCPTDMTDCGNCDLASSGSSGSGSKTATTTAPPSTDDSAANPSTTSLTPAPSGASSSLNDGTGTSPPSSSSSSADSSSSANTTKDDAGLATWQIALIICSCVLVIAVVMMTITSCYCKARNEMNNNIQNEQERNEYDTYWHQNGGEDVHDPQLAQSAFGPTTTQGGRSSFTSTHSRPNSTKNVPYSEPTFVDDRIMGRPTGRQSVGSTADLPGVYQPFPTARHVGDSRKNIAIEL